MRLGRVGWNAKGPQIEFPKNPRRIGIAALAGRLGIARTTIWRWYTDGTFPMPHYIGTRRAWWVHEIEAWEAAQSGQGAPVRPGLLYAAAAAAAAAAASSPADPPAEMSLREMREAVGPTQADVATMLEKTLGELSRFEHREDALLSSLRECVKALGEELKLWAVLGDKRLRLNGV